MFWIQNQNGLLICHLLPLMRNDNKKNKNSTLWVWWSLNNLTFIEILVTSSINIEWIQQNNYSIVHEIHRFWMLRYKKMTSLGAIVFTHVCDYILQVLCILKYTCNYLIFLFLWNRTFFSLYFWASFLI